jgi:DNA-binding NtrC family response regulator
MPLRGASSCAGTMFFDPEDFDVAGMTDTCDESMADESCLSLEASEKNTILRARWNRPAGIQKEAAEVLGISRRAIHYKIKKYGIDAGSIKARH